MKSPLSAVVPVRRIFLCCQRLWLQTAHLSEHDADPLLRKPEVEEIVARLSPRPDVPPSLRRLPAPRSVSTTPPPSLVTSTLTTPDPSSIPTPAADQAVRPLPIHPAAVEPLSPDRYKLQLTIGGDTLQKLRLAKDRLRQAQTCA